MSKRCKVSDEQIIEKLQNPDLSYKQIAEELGVAWAGSFNNRCKQLEKNNDLPGRIPKRRGNPNWRKARPEIPAVSPAVVQADDRPERSGQDKPFPFEPKDQVRFGGRLHTVRHVGANRMTMHENATMKSVTIMLDDYNAGRVEILKVEEKPPIRTTGEAIMLKRRKEDEEPDIAEIKIAGTDPKTLHLDLEMDDWTEPKDYIDPEWGVVEKEISDKILGRREYLDKIDRLLDVVMSDCGMELVFDAVVLATRMLAKGIREEAKRQ